MTMNLNPVFSSRQSWRRHPGRAKEATSAIVRSQPDWSAVITAPICGECGRVNTDGERGWQGHLVDLDDDGEDEVILFCPRCADREFGTKGRSA